MNISSVYTLAMPKVKKTDNCQRKSVFVGVCACGCGCTYMHVCKCVPVCVCVCWGGGDVNWLLLFSLFPRDQNDSYLVYTAN